MKSTIMLECPKCHYTDFVKQKDLKYVNKSCTKCSVEFIETIYEHIDDSGIILDIIDLELEHRNYLEFNKLPQDLYNSLRTCDNDFNTAKKIAEVLDRNFQ